MFYKCFLALFAATMLLLTGCETEVIGTVVNSEKAVVKDRRDKYHNVAIVTFKTDGGLTRVYCDPSISDRFNDFWQKDDRYILTLADENNTLGGYLQIQSLREAEGRLIDGDNLIMLEGADEIASDKPSVSKDDLQKLRKDLIASKTALQRLKKEMREYRWALDEDMEIMEELVLLLMKSDRQQEDTLAGMQMLVGPSPSSFYRSERPPLTVVKEENEEPKVTAQPVSTNVANDD